MSTPENTPAADNADAAAEGTAAPVTFRVPAGTAAGAAMRELGLPNKGPEAIVCVKEAKGDTAGQLRDLSWAPEQDVDVTAVPANTDEGRGVIRHSCAHVLAQAVQKEFPGTQAGYRPRHR